ncbi:unnamed protein product [Euphydryas editha]|uniref:(+)RNA virus helicase C-terminal domain-containing protein n=1 Tax=Euphydryas editha TaxID=104508 RepID=A0AAU9UB47_EUPED|nr:unnamed protein product [Euphydryas editha]
MQEEKKFRMDQVYGTVKESRIMTIYEAQGHTYSEVVIVQTKTERVRINQTMPHPVVVLTRHTNTCVYYADDVGDAIGRGLSADRWVT